MRATTRYWSWTLTALLLSACREELGPETFATTRVVGVVRLAGEPVRGGWIEFIPVDGTIGNLRSAPIQADGTFRVDRVAVGRNIVGLANPPIDRAYARFFRSFQSPIRRKVPAGPESSLTIDLYEEAMRRRTAQGPSR